MFSSLGRQIAHASTIPLGGSDFRQLQDLITKEKEIVTSAQKFAVDVGKAAEALRVWGLAEGVDLGDVMTHSSAILAHLVAALNVFANHESTIRGYLKEIRTKEEQLEELKRRRRNVAAKADAAEKKLNKMGSENKYLAQQSNVLSQLSEEIRQLDAEIANDEARINDYKRGTARTFMLLKFGGLLELGEKSLIVGEIGKLIVNEIPLEQSQPGVPRRPYTSNDRTANLALEASRCIGEVRFAADPDPGALDNLLNHNNSQRTLENPRTSQPPSSSNTVSSGTRVASPSLNGTLVDGTNEMGQMQPGQSAQMGTISSVMSIPSQPTGASTTSAFSVMSVPQVIPQSQPSSFSRGSNFAPQQQPYQSIPPAAQQLPKTHAQVQESVAPIPKPQTMTERQPPVNLGRNISEDSGSSTPPNRRSWIAPGPPPALPPSLQQPQPRLPPQKVDESLIDESALDRELEKERNRQQSLPHNLPELTLELGGGFSGFGFGDSPTKERSSPVKERVQALEKMDTETEKRSPSPVKKPSRPIETLPKTNEPDVPAEQAPPPEQPPAVTPAYTPVNPPANPDQPRALNPPGSKITAGGRFAAFPVKRKTTLVDSPASSATATPTSAAPGALSNTPANASATSLTSSNTGTINSAFSRSGRVGLPSAVRRGSAEDTKLVRPVQVRDDSDSIQSDGGRAGSKLAPSLMKKRSVRFAVTPPITPDTPGFGSETAEGATDGKTDDEGTQEASNRLSMAGNVSNAQKRISMVTPLQTHKRNASDTIEAKNSESDAKFISSTLPTSATTDDSVLSELELNAMIDAMAAQVGAPVASSSSPVQSPVDNQKLPRDLSYNYGESPTLSPGSRTISAGAFKRPLSKIGPSNQPPSLYTSESPKEPTRQSMEGSRVPEIIQPAQPPTSPVTTSSPTHSASIPSTNPQTAPSSSEFHTAQSSPQPSSVPTQPAQSQEYFQTAPPPPSAQPPQSPDQTSYYLPPGAAPPASPGFAHRQQRDSFYNPPKTPPASLLPGRAVSPPFPVANPAPPLATRSSRSPSPNSNVPAALRPATPQVMSPVSPQYAVPQAPHLQPLAPHSPFEFGVGGNNPGYGAGRYSTNLEDDNWKNRTGPHQWR